MGSLIAANGGPGVDLEASPKVWLRRLLLRPGTRIQSQIKPYVVETIEGLVEVADLFLDLAHSLQACGILAMEDGLRVRASVQSGAGCRATYFYHARRLRPTAPVPHIALSRTAPPRGFCGRDGGVLTHESSA